MNEFRKNHHEDMAVCELPRHEICLERLALSNKLTQWGDVIHDLESQISFHLNP